jgi:antitoxin PrlF
MPAAQLSSKNQVVVPQEVRVALGVGSGDRIEFVQVEPGRWEVIAATGEVQGLKGLIKKPAKPVSIDAMNAAIAAQGAKAR